jgi:hypothetical protein
MFKSPLQLLCESINSGDIRGNKRQISNLISDNELICILNRMGAGQFAWHVVHGTWERPMCKVCGGPTKFNAYRRRYAPTCSKVCAYADPDRTGKIESTMEVRYGVSNAAHSSELAEKKRKTLIDRYGANHPSRIPELKLKKKQTMQARWGVDNPSHSPEIQKRKIATNQMKRGVDWAPQDPNVILKMQQTCIDRYGLTHSRYKSKTPQQLAALTNPDIFKNEINDLTIFEAAGKLGVSTKTIYILTAKYDCRDLLNANRTNKSSYELKVRNFLDNLGVYYIPNTKDIISPFEIDIFLPNHNIAIEVGSAFWHSDTYGRDIYYHQDKWKKCKELGLTLFQWFDEDILVNWHLTESRLKRAIGISVPVIGARKVEIGACSFEQEVDFLDEWHAKGHSIDRNVALACFFDGAMIGIMTIKHRKDRAIIERWATDTTKSWPGLFSKTLSHWIKSSGFKGQIETWCDNRLGTGTVYSSSGFIETKLSKPGYWYFKGIGLESRLKYQKHKLKDLFDLTENDLTKTEWQIMKEQGYHRFWDAGHTLWTKQIS